MTINDNDVRLIAVMRRYFAVREELQRTKDLLEAARRETGQTIGEFYHIRGNNEHRADVIRTVTLKKEMDFLMGLGASWARGEDLDLGGDGARQQSGAHAARLEP